MLLRDSKRQSPGNNAFLEESEKIWSCSSSSVNERLESFTKYVSRESLTKFLARSEVFKRQLDIHGSVIEVGVARGASLFTWFHLSSILEPANYSRRIIGFDTFTGIPSLSSNDYLGPQCSEDLRINGFCMAEGVDEEILAAASMHDRTRFLGHISKLQLVKGSLEETLPSFLKENPQLVVSLLHIDADNFIATEQALKAFLPRIPQGGIILCDELNDERFPGETVAVREILGFHNIKLERISYCPMLSFWIRT